MRKELLITISLFFIPFFAYAHITYCGVLIYSMNSPLPYVSIRLQRNEFINLLFLVNKLKNNVCI